MVKNRFMEGSYFDMLMEDTRFREGLKSCMNCGVCTGVCPAAEFYNYDPRQIVSIVQTRDQKAIEDLLKGDRIWYCGECLSCRPRCPRGNVPAYIIQSLRTLSQRLGLFVHSEKGRQQYAILKTIGRNILNTGYCMRPELIDPDLHPEQGPVWRWIYNNHKDVFARFGENYGEEGPGAMRKIDDNSLEEIRQIFEVSGAKKFMDDIERCSLKKAEESGFCGTADEYFMEVYRANSNNDQ